MSIWIIIIIIIILAVLIFGYLYYGKYSGGAEKYSITKANATTIIGALNDRIVFDDPNHMDDDNTTLIKNAKRNILALLKDDGDISDVGDNYNAIELGFYAKIDIDINTDFNKFVIDNKFTVTIKTGKKNKTNYNYKLVSKYFSDLVTIKKLGTIKSFNASVNDNTLTQDKLNKRFRLLFFNIYDVLGIDFDEDKKLVQKSILISIDISNTDDIYTLLKYKYRLFKNDNIIFNRTVDSYIENFYNTTYQEELFNKINTYIRTAGATLDDNLIKSMYNYYLNVKDHYVKYLNKDYASWQLDFLAHIPVRFARDDFKQIPYYVNTIDVDTYINYYHDIEKYKNTTYTYVDNTMKKLSVETIYGIIYNKMDLFNIDQEYKLEDINADPYDTNIENVELILLVVQLLDLDKLADIWNGAVSKKDNLTNIITYILINLVNCIKIHDFELPTNFIINFLQKYNKDDILFNDIKTELTNQDESYKLIKTFCETINNYNADFWRIMKIKHYNDLSFDILYRINIYGKLMIFKDDGNNIDCLANFDEVCKTSYKKFTTSNNINLNIEATKDGEDNKKMKKCVGLYETDPIVPYEHKDDDDIDNNDICLMNKLKITGTIFEYNNKFVFNKYENTKLCNYNTKYNYNDYAELYPNTNYNIEYLREYKFYICSDDNFTNIGNNNKNYLKWELKDLDMSITKYYTDETSVNGALSADVGDFVKKTNLAYDIDYFHNTINNDFTKYIKNTKCIYFILQNQVRLRIPEYSIFYNANTIKINKLYFDHMIKLYPEINIPAIDTPNDDFYEKQFSYKNTITNDDDLVISDMRYGDKYLKVKEVKIYNDLNDKYTNSFTAGRKSITSTLWNSNTSDSKNKKKFDELQTALDYSADIFSPLDADEDGYRKRPNELKEAYDLLSGGSYVNMLNFTKLIDNCIENYNNNKYNDINENSIIMKANFDKIKTNDDKKYILNYKFTKVFSSLFSEIIAMDYKIKNQEADKEPEDEKIIAAEIIAKEYNQVLQENKIITKDYEYKNSMSTHDIQSFLKDCMTDLLLSSSDDTKASIMYLKVDDLRVSELFNDIDIKGNTPIIYIAMYEGKLNTDAIMNQLNKKNNKLFSKVNESKEFKQTKAKMLAYKKVGNVYKRAPEQDAFYSSDK